MKALCVTILVLSALAFVQGSSQLETQRSTATCNACKYIVSSVYHTESDAEILQNSGLGEKCKEFGISQAMCQSAISKIAGPIRAAKAKGVPLERACESIGTCSSQSAKRDPSFDVTGTLLDGKLCGLCELSVTIIQNYIGSGQSEPAIKAALLHFCNGLEQPTSTLCVIAVETYLTKIIHGLGNQNIPNLLCTELTLCSPN